MNSMTDNVDDALERIKQKFDDPRIIERIERVQDVDDDDLEAKMIRNMLETKYIKADDEKEWNKFIEYIILKMQQDS